MVTTAREKTRRGGTFRSLVCGVSVFALSVGQVVPVSADVTAAGGALATDTNIDTVGTTTTVTTGTITAGIGYNNFDRFEVDTGTTVVLTQPGATDALVNVVRNSAGTPSRIDGTLNMVKEGGGQSNVFLLDHNGIVVGNGGVINAGRLTMSTAAEAVGAEILREGLGQQLTGDDDTPTSSQILGLDELAASDIEVYGQINAEGLALRAGARMILDGSINVDAPGVEGTAAPIVINILGKPEADQVFVEDGTIRFFAGGAASASGGVTARRGNTGGQITGWTGGDLTIEPTARLDADGTGAFDAGSIIFTVSGSAAIDSAATVTAKAEAGDGGIVFAETLAEDDRLALSGTWDASTESGERTGGIYVLADIVDIVDDLSTNGADLVVEGRQTVEVSAGATVSTRRFATGTPETATSTGTSGDLVLLAKDVDIEAGAGLYAQGDGGFEGGLVGVLARDDTTESIWTFSRESRSATVDITQATLHGGTVAVYAFAQSSNFIALELSSEAEIVEDAIDQTITDVNTSGSQIISVIENGLDLVGQLLIDQAPVLNILSPLQVFTMEATAEVNITDSTITGDGNWKGRGAPLPAMNIFYSLVPTTTGLLTAPGSDETSQLLDALPDIPDSFDLSDDPDNPAEIDLTGVQVDYTDPDNYFELPDFLPYDPFYAGEDSGQFNNSLSTIPQGLVEGILSVFDPGMMDMRLELPYYFDTTNDSVFVHSHAHTNVQILPPLSFGLGFSYTSNDADSHARILGSTVTSLAGDIELSSTALDTTSVRLITPKVPLLGQTGAPDFALGAIIGYHDIENQLLVDGGTTSAGGDLNAQARTVKARTQNLLVNAGQNGQIAIAYQMDIGTAFTDAALGGVVETGTNAATPGSLLLEAETLHFGKDHATTSTLGIANLAFAALKQGLAGPIQQALQFAPQSIQSRFSSGEEADENNPRKSFALGAAIDIGIEQDDTFATLGGQYHDFDADRALTDLSATTVAADGAVAVNADLRFARPQEGGARLNRATVARMGKLNLALRAQLETYNAGLIASGAEPLSREDYLGEFGNALFVSASVGLLSGETQAELGGALTITDATDVTVAAKTTYPTIDVFAELADDFRTFGEEVGTFSQIDDDLSDTAVPDESPSLPNVVEYLNPFGYITTLTRTRAEQPTDPGSIVGNDKETASEAQSVAVAVSGNFFQTDNQTRAIVRDGADITSTGTLTVEAEQRALFIHMGNRPNEFFNGFGTNENVNNSIGGFFNMQRLISRTEAVVEGGAILRAGAIDIDADTEIINIDVVAAGGSAAKVGVNGAVAVTAVDAMTIARVDEDASLTAGAVTLNAGDDSLIFSLAGAAAAGGNVGVGASVGLNFITRTIYAGIGPELPEDFDGPAVALTADPDKVVVDADSLTIEARNDALDISTTLAGARVSGQPVDESAPAPEDESNDDDMIIPTWLFADDEENAVNDQRQSTRQEGSDGSQQQSGWAVSGAASLNLILGNALTAELATGGKVQVDDALSVTSVNRNLGITGAGAASFSTSADVKANALAGAFSVAVDERDLLTTVRGATITAGSILFKADDRSELYGVSIGGAGAANGRVTLAGSVTVNVITGDTETRVTDVSLTADDGTTIQAVDDSMMVAVGGAAAINLSKTQGAGVGVGIGVNVSTRGTRTAVTGATTLADATSITIGSSTTSGLYSFGVSVGVGKTGVAGSIASSDIFGQSETTVGQDSGDRIAIDTAALTVTSFEDYDAWSLGGAITAGQTTAVGGALTVNLIDARAVTQVKRVDVGAFDGTSELGAVSLRADSDSTIGTLAVAGGVAVQGNGVGVGLSTNNISSTTKADFTNGTVTEAASFSAVAENDRIISALTGGIAAAGRGAGGFGLSVNLLTGNETSVSLNGSTIGTDTAGITGQAISDATIRALSVGISASRDLSIGGAATVNATVATTKVSADGATLTARDGITLDADDTSLIQSLAGGAALSAGGSGVGAGLAVNAIAHDTSITAAGASLVTLAGPVLVSVLNDADIDSLSVGLAVASSNAVSGAIAIGYIGNSATVDVSDTTIVAGAGGSFDDITLEATKTSQIDILSGAAAGGGGNAVGGAVTVAIIADTVAVDLDVDRDIIGATLTATASNTGTINAIAISGSVGGNVGFAGSLVYTQIGTPGDNAATLASPESPDPDEADEAAEGQQTAEAQRDDAFTATFDRTGQDLDFSLDGADLTRARVELGSGTTTLGALTVQATEISEITSAAGAVTGGGSAGIGIGIGLNLLFGGTEAQLIVAEETTATLAGNVTVAATQTGTIDTYGVAGAIGGTSVGAAGSILLNVVDRSLGARITAADDDGDADETRLALSGFNLNVTATQGSEIAAYGGGASFGGTAGVGGAIVINALSDDGAAVVENVIVDASVGSDPTRPLAASGDVSVTATNTSDLTTASVAGGGGVGGGFAGSIAINVADATLAARLDRATILADDVTLTATATNTLIAASGNVAIGGGGAAGVGVVTNASRLQVLAEADGTRIRSFGNTRIKALADTDMQSFAVAGAASGGVSFSGSGVGNAAENVVTARVANTGAETTLWGVTDGGGAPVVFGGSDIVARGSVELSAVARASVSLGGGENDTPTVSDGGDGDSDAIPSVQINFAGGGAGAIGASVAVNKTANEARTVLTDNSRLVGLGYRTLPGTETADGLRTIRGAHIAALTSSTVGQVSANGAAAGGAAVVGLFNFNIVSDTALVTVGDGTATGGARVNTEPLAATLDTIDGTLDGASSLQDTTLEAFTRSDVDSFALGAAVSGGTSVGASSATSLFSSEASVLLQLATITAERDLDVTADTVSTLDSYVIGVAGGFVGAAASVGVDLFQSVADVSILGSTLAAGIGGSDDATLTVDATTTNTANSFVGGLGAGAVGASGGINVTSFASTARTRVDSLELDTGAEASRLLSFADMEVGATTGNTMANYAVSGSGGLGALALATNVNLVTSRTEVVIGDGQTLQAQGQVDIAAAETTTISGLAGSAAVGGLSVGASFDYANFAGKTIVDLGDDNVIEGGVATGFEGASDDDAVLTAGGTDGVSISAVATRAVTSNVIVGSAGSLAAAASLGIVELGGIAPDDQGERGSQLSDVDLVIDTPQTTSGEGGTDPASIEGLAVYAGGDQTRRDSAAARTALNVSGSVEDDNVGIEMGDGNRIVGGGDVSLTSTANTGVRMRSGNASLSAIGALSLSATIANVSSASVIDLGTGTTILADGAVTIGALTAETDGFRAAEGVSYALAASLGVDGSAGYVGTEIDSTARVTAGAGLTIGGINDAAAGSVDISADRQDTTSAEIRSVAASLVGGAGATIAEATASGTSEVSLLGTAGSRANITAGSLSVRTLDSTAAQALASASRGGVGASISGTVSTARNTGVTNLTAAHLTATAGSATFRNRSTGLSVATAKGLTVGGGLSIGVSSATADTDTTLTASLTDLDIEAGSITIENAFRRGTATVEGATVRTNARALSNSAGGGVLAGNGSVSNAYLDYDVDTTVSGRLISSGGLEIAGRATDATARAEAVGKVFGLAVVGTTEAFAGRKVPTAPGGTVVTRVTAGNLAAGGDLEILSANTPDVSVEVSSGTGGLVAGAGGTADVDFGTRTRTRIGEGGETRIMGFTVAIGAGHDGRTQSRLDNVAGALLGKSGARATTVFDTEVDTILGGGTRITANAVDIDATNSLTRPLLAYNIKSGSGGLFDLPAMEATVEVTAATDLTIGDGAQIIQIGDRLQPGAFDIGIATAMNLNDRQTLDAGGAVAAPIGDATIDVKENAATLTVGDARLFALGDMNLYNGGDSDIYVEVDTVAYGLAGAPVSNSYATYRGENDIVLLEGARLESLANVFLNAGAVQTRVQSVKVNAESRTFNKTAIPIPVTPAADAAAWTYSRIRLDEGAEIKAVRDFYLLAEAGKRDVMGFGLGKDLYREAAEEVGNFFGGLVGADEVSLDIESGTSFDNTTAGVAFGLGQFPNGITVNGLVRAGSRNRQVLLLDRDDQLANEVAEFNAGADYTDEMAEEIDFFVVEDVSVVALLQDRIDELRGFLANPNITDASKDVFVGGILVSSGDPARQAWIAEINSLVTRAGAAAGQLTDKVVIGEIVAVEGNIILRGDYVDGGATGSLVAPGDAEVIVEVNSGSMLEVLSRNDYLEAALAAGEITAEEAIFGPEQETTAILIPSQDGGLVTFNDVSVTSAADLQARAAGRPGTYAFDVQSGADDDPPEVVLKTVQPAGPSRGTASINIAGDVSNLRGGVTVSSDGDVDLRGDIAGLTIDVRAAGNMTVGYIPGIRNVSGDPIAQYGAYFAARQADARLLTRLAAINREYGLPYSDPAVDRRVSVNAFPLRSSSTGGLRAGKNIYISADKLNINGLISAGIGTFEVTLLAGLEDELQALRDAGGEGKVILHDASFPVDKRRFTSPYISVDTSVRVIYDHDADQVLIEDMVLQGGEVYITGDVISTGGGRIEALQGYGRVEVNSAIDTAVVLNRIDLSGGGTEGISGKVRITDTSRTVGDGNFLITEYRREGGDVLRYDNDGPDGTITEFREFGEETIAILSPGILQETREDTRAATYAPTRDRDIIVVTSEATTRVVEETRDQLIIIGITGSSSVDREVKSFNTVSNVTNPDILAPYVGPSLDGGDYAYALRSYGMDYDVDTTAWKETYDDVRWWKVGSGWRGDKRTVTSVSRQNYEHRLKADYDVSVFFNGVDAADAGLSIATTGNVVFSTTVLNPTGETSITSSSGDILTGSKNVVLSVGDTSLTATSGAIAGLDGALRLDMAAGSVLDATAFGSIDIREMRGDLIVGRVATTERSNAQGLARPGTVTLGAQRSILGDPGTAGPQVEGADIALTAEQGGIGSAGAPLRIDSEADGVLTARATGDIAIAETTGDMRLDSVTSLDGGVRLEAATGSILDRNAIETKDTRTLEALQAFWTNELALDESEAGSPRAQVQIDALEAENTRLNAEYWDAREANGGAPVTFTLDPDQRESFQRGQQQPDGSFAGGWTDAMVAEYEGRISDLYASWNASQSARPDDFAYEATPDDTAAILQEMGWSDEELTRRLQSGLVTERGDLNIRDESPNVTARGDITLVVRDRVGELLPDYVIQSKDRFSDADLEVLYGATRQDITVDTEAGEIRVRQNEDLNFAFTSDGGLPTGKLRVEAANSDIFLAAETPAALANVVGTQAVEIRVDGLISDMADGDFALEGRVVALESGNDNAIGTADVPLTVNILSGGSLRANAGTDVFIRAPQSALPLEAIFAGGTARLVAAGAITDNVGTAVPRIVATDIDLAAPSLGTSGAPLGLRVLDTEAGSVRLVATAGDAFGRAYTDLPLSRVDVARGGRIDTAGGQVLAFTGTDTMTFGDAATFLLSAGGGIDLSGAMGTDVGGGTLGLLSDGTVGSAAAPLETQVAVLTYGTLTPDATDRDTTLRVVETDALTVTTVTQNANPDSDTEITTGGDLTVGTIASVSTTRLDTGANLTGARVISDRLEMIATGAIGSASPVDATVATVTGLTTDGDLNLLLRDRDHTIELLSAGGAGALIVTGQGADTTVTGAGISTAGGALTGTFDRLLLAADMDATDGPLSLNVQGDMDVTGGAQVRTGNATDAALAATVAGTITDRDQTAPVFVADALGALTTLDLGRQGNVGPIGLLLEVDRLNALVRQGDLHLSEAGDLTAERVEALAGNVDLRAGGDLTLGTLASGGTGQRTTVAVALGDIAADAAVVDGDLIKLFSLGGDMRGITRDRLGADTEDRAEVWLLAGGDLGYEEQAGDLRLAVASAQTGDLDLAVAAGGAEIGLLGAGGDMALTSTGDLTVNMIGRTGIDLADEVGLELIDRDPTDFGIVELASPETLTLAATDEGATLTVALANLRRSATLLADVVDVNLYDVTPGDDLRLTVTDATGDFTEVVDVDLLADGPRIDLLDPFESVLPQLENRRIAEIRPADDTLPTADSTLFVERARVRTGEITSAGPQITAEDMIIDGDVWIRQRSFDLLLQTEFDEISTIADTQMLAVQVPDSGPNIVGVANFTLAAEILIDTDTLLSVNRRREGVILSGTRGFGFLVGTELQVIVNRFLTGSGAGIGGFHGPMPWVPDPSVVDGETGEVSLPLTLASL